MPDQWTIRDTPLTPEEHAQVGFNARQAVNTVLPQAVVTENYRDPNSPLGRKTPNSTHGRGLDTVDIRPIPGMTFEQVQQHFIDTGHKVLFSQDEVKHPSPHSTGKHWHFRLAPDTPPGDWSVVPQANAPAAQASAPAETRSMDPLSPQFDPAYRPTPNPAEQPPGFFDQKWGLDPETYAALNTPGLVNPALIADAVSRMMHASGWGIDKASEFADYLYTGSTIGNAIDKMYGVGMHPSELIGGMAEAFPLGGAELGGIRPHVGGIEQAAARLPTAVEEGWQNILNVGDKSEILDYAQKHGFQTTPETLDNWIQTRHGNAGVVYQKPVETVAPDGTTTATYAPEGEGLTGRVTDTGPIPPRSGNIGVRATDSSLPARTAEQEAAYQEAVGRAQEWNNIPDERLPQALKERDFQADVKMELNKAGHDQNILHQPEHNPDAPKSLADLAKIAREDQARAQSRPANDGPVGTPEEQAAHQAYFDKHVRDGTISNAEEYARYHGLKYDPANPPVNPANDYGTPKVSESGNLTHDVTSETNRNKAVYATYHAPGKDPIQFGLLIDKEGKTVVNVETTQIGADGVKNSRGTQFVKGALEDTLREYPEITEITGIRKGKDVGEPVQGVSAAKITKIREAMAKRDGNNVVPLDRPVGPGDIPEDLPRGVPVNDNVGPKPVAEGKIVPDARSKYVNVPPADKARLNAIGTRIDALDEAYANEVDPVKKDQLAAEQDALMDEEKAIRNRHAVLNDNVKETPLDAAYRAAVEAEDRRNKLAGWDGNPTDPRSEMHPNSKGRRAWNKEITDAEDELTRTSEAHQAAIDAEKQAKSPPSETPVGGGSGEPPAPPGEPPAGGGGAGEPPEPPRVEDITARMTSALTNAEKLNKEQQIAYTAARREKLQSVNQARATLTGEDSLHAELGALKGEMPKVDFTGIKDQFSPEEITTLFDHVKNFPELGVYNSIRARVGLSKLLEGQLPQAGELDLLRRIFPKDFIQAALKHKSMMSKINEGLIDALSIPRTLMSSVDLSAPLRQGLFLINRKEWWNSIVPMFKAFGSERAYKAIMADIETRPSYAQMMEDKLALADLGADLTAREEAFGSRFVEKYVPGVRRSERAYTGFLNKLRADTYDAMMRDAKAAGRDVINDTKLRESTARFINNATGRGSIGSLSSVGPILNATFFSPRLIISRLNLLNPVEYARLDPLVRHEAMKSLISLGGIALTATMLAKMGGADVETDPRSSSFAKIQDGNISHDILGGFGQYITLGARLATNQTKTRAGDVNTLGTKYGQDTSLTVAGNFLVSKASPIASFIADFLRRKDYQGNPFNLSTAVISRLTPLYVADAVKVLQETGATPRALEAIPGAFGVNTQVNKPKDAWTAEGYTVSEEVPPGEWTIVK